MAECDLSNRVSHKHLPKESPFKRRHSMLEDQQTRQSTFRILNLHPLLCVP